MLWDLYLNQCSLRTQRKQLHAIANPSWMVMVADNIAEHIIFAAPIVLSQVNHHVVLVTREINIIIANIRNYIQNEFCLQYKKQLVAK